MLNLLKLILSTIIFYSILNAKDIKRIPIVIQGNSIILTSELENILDATRTSKFKIWKKNITSINTIIIPHIKTLLKKFYEIEGFFFVKIITKKYKNMLYIKIEENSYININKINIKTNFTIKEKFLSLKKFTRFREENLKKTKLYIQDLLIDKGYCSALINIKAYISLKKKEANVKIKINKGDLCFFSKIKIHGLKDINRSIILSKIFIREGDRYNIKLIRDSYKSLYKLDTLDSLYIDYKKKIYNKIPININLIEVKKNSNQSYGIAYSNRLSTQLKFKYKYKNFMGNAKNISLNLLLSKKKKYIENTFYAPSFIKIKNYYFDILNSISYENNRDINNFNDITFLDKISLSFNQKELQINLGVGIEYIDLVKINLNHNKYLIIYPLFNINYDLRDSKVDPKNGYYLSSSFEYGIKYNVTSVLYLKNLTEFRAIKTIENITYSAVTKIGSINFANVLFPESKKFFAGGSYSNRAYRYETIGIIDTNGSITNNGAFFLKNLSLELNMPLYKNIKGAIFYDNTLLLSKFSLSALYTFKNSISTVGIGLRYLTPIAPFKIDIGVNVNNIKDYSLLFQIGQSF